MFKKTVVILFAAIFISGLGAVIPARAAEKVDVRKMTEYLAEYLLSVRRLTAQMVDVINTHGAKVGEPLPQGAPYSFKGIIPAYMGRVVGEDFFKNTNIRIKQTTLGKGEFGPRNIYNAPDDWENQVLTRFYEPSYPKGKGYGEDTELDGKRIYRYMLPLYIEKACLKCHGNPATSPTGDGLDMAGKPMENYKEGEVRGAISIIFPLDEAG